MKCKLILLLALFATEGFSQEVNVMVTDIREERALDQYYSGIELTLKLNGITVDENRRVKIGKITKAVDNLGNTLSEKTSSFGQDYKDRNEVSFKLTAPLRNATELSTVEGVISYFSPTVENKGKVEVTKPLDRYNSNFLKGADPSVKLILIDEEGLKKMKSENEATFNKEMERLKKENAIEEKVEGLMSGFKDFFDGLFNSGSYGSALNFYVEDPEKKIVSINVYDEKGTKVSNGYFSSGSQMSITLNEEPKNTWRVDVLLENPKALKEYKFKLNNVFLP